MVRRQSGDGGGWYNNMRASGGSDGLKSVHVLGNCREEEDALQGMRESHLGVWLRRRRPSMMEVDVRKVVQVWRHCCMRRR